MQTKNIIQSSVNVIKITNLKKGDLYKRIDDSSYSTDVYYGIVKDIHNGGEKTFFEAVEYKKSYSTVSADFKIFSGEKDLNIFPSTLEEIQDEFSSVVSTLEKEIENKQKEIEGKRKCIAETNMLLSGELANMLQSAEYKELTQQEYNRLKIERANAVEI